MSEVMEASVFEITKWQPGGAIEADFAAIESRIAEIVSVYEGLVVTDEYLPQAKKDRAYLNGLVKSVEQRRIEVKKKYMEPVAAFEAQVKKLLEPVATVSANLDKQIKDAEEREKSDKRAAIAEHYAAFAGLLAEAVPFERIFDAKWLNKGCDLKTAVAEVEAIAEKIAANEVTLDSLNLPHAIEAKAEFYATLDIGKAVARSQAISDREAKAAEIVAQQEANRAAFVAEDIPLAEPTLEPVFDEVVREWTFTVTCTREQLDGALAALKALGLTGTVK